MCVSAWETTLESVQIFKYPVKAMPGSPSLLHTLSHMRGMHVPGFPVLMQGIGAERAADELQAPQWVAPSNFTHLCSFITWQLA